MTLRSSVRRNIGLAALFSLLLALLPFGPSVTVADASPSAGSCARDGDGTLVCNVLNQNLDFSRSGDTTQSGGWVPSNNIDATAGNSVTYSSVFTGGGYTIDAVVSVESKTGTGVVLDANGSSGTGAFPGGFNNSSIVMLAQEDSQIEVTITFRDRARKEAVTMQNLTVGVIDIDGHETSRADESKEFATFQGLNGYTVTSATQLNVSTSEDEPSFSGGITPGNESTSPESGVRQFYTEEGVGTGVTRHSADVDMNNAVAVTFPPTSTVGFVAGTYGGIAGTIAFTFGTANFGDGVSTSRTEVSSGSHTITYDLDGGSGPVPDPVTTSVAVNLSSGTGITKSSIPFSRWSTQSGGVGVKRQPGDSFLPSKDTKFYAVYGYRLTFDANAGTGSMNPQDASGSTALTANAFTRTGYAFAGWNTEANGSGTAYADGAAFPFTADDTLFAQWAEEFDVTFDSNGGSGSMSAQIAGGSTALTANAFTRTGYAFAGWNTDANGLGTAYADGAAFPFTADDTLHAQWLKSSPPIEATHDIWIEGDGSDPDDGTSTSLILKMGTSGTGSEFKRVALLRFDYDPSYVWTSAALDLVVSGNTKGVSDPEYGNSFKSFNVNVYGANDADWAESSLDFTSASTTASDWAISFTHPYSTPGATFIGNISVPASSTSPSGPYPTVGETFSVSNPDLVTFLNNDSDGKVTFFISRSDESDQSNLQFASSENTTYDGPRLTVPAASFSYAVAYDVNLGTGTVPDQGAYVVGTPYTVASPSSIIPPSGQSFAGWNSRSDGTGTAYPVGFSNSTAASVTLYAQYTTNPVVTFNSNDGTSQISYQAVSSGTATPLTANSFTRSGFTFSGWDPSSGGGGTAYSDGSNITTASAVTLYPQWTATASGSTGGSGSSGGSSVSNPVVTPTTPIATPRQTRLTLVGPNTDPVPRPVERLGLRFDPDAPSRATIGRAPANLVTTPLGSGGLSMAAGAFQFGVSFAEASGAEVLTDTPSQSPELFAPRGQSAAVTGKGSYPGSFVQWFLPGNGSDSRELARIPVRSDGTFASDLSFQAGALELPVPIGRQVLQVVGYDERGNQTVVDMTVNIGQGVPAPEPNRQIGELPALTAGQSLATSGGIPETVSVTGAPETGNVVVEGSGWVISVNADRDNGVVENEDGNVLVRLNPSSVGTTFGNGFLPGTLATVWLFSEPTLMTTVTVDDNGEFSAEFLVDARLIAPGEHTLQVQGVGSDGYIKAANLGVLVEQPVEVTAESASGLLWWVLGFFVLALLLMFFVLLARRRRRQDA